VHDGCLLGAGFPALLVDTPIVSGVTLDRRSSVRNSWLAGELRGSQGSASPILTRGTLARTDLMLVGTEESIRAAVNRPVARVGLT
jgi:hypothetical protein